MHVRQPEVPPRIPIRQPLMIEPQQMQQRGVQVVDMNLVLHRLEAELISRAVSLPAFDAAAIPAIESRDGCDRGR